MKATVRRSVLATAAALLLTGGAATAAAPFQLTSSVFADDAPLAAKYVGNDTSNPNCVGENISPPLAWSNPPQGTKSYAILMADLEDRRGLGVVGWIAYCIPASATGFAEGDVGKASDKFVGGKSTRNLATYFGPCPPPGGWHHYAFKQIATDLDTKALQPGLTRDEAIAALNGHAKGGTGLIGRFKHR
jgi:Raf kinase inhibitor-like YbhB/YbcL family protein